MCEMANRLVDAGHHSNHTNVERKDKVLQAWENIKSNSTKKRAELDESKLFQEFRAKAGETNIYYRKEEIDQRGFIQRWYWQSKSQS